MLDLHPLPAEARALLDRAGAPPRLVVHLELVHDVAARLLEGLLALWPDLKVDAQAVLFGAATHDIGKALVPEELSGPGSQHEARGRAWLEEQGVPPVRARFAQTHAAWKQGGALRLEDLLVALADRVWKGARDAELETPTAAALSRAAGIQPWEAYSSLDELLTGLAADADERLEIQAAAPLSRG
jgi:hypothetical protein